MVVGGWFVVVILNIEKPFCGVVGGLGLGGLGLGSGGGWEVRGLMGGLPKLDDDDDDKDDDVDGWTDGWKDDDVDGWMDDDVDGWMDGWTLPLPSFHPAPPTVGTVGGEEKG